MMKLSLKQLSKPCVVIACLLASFEFMPLTVCAQMFNGPVSRATGNTGRAAIEFSEGPLLNPAVITQTQGAGLAVHRGSSLWAAAPHDEFALVVVDRSPGVLLPASFTAVLRQEAEGSTLQDYQFILAHQPMGRVSVGVAVHHLRYEKPTQEIDFSSNNMHLGLLYTPYANLGFALVAYNVFPEAEAPTHAQVMEALPGVGIGAQYYMSEMIRFRMDMAKNFSASEGNALDAMFGFETYVLVNLAVRMGYAWQNTRGKELFTTGLGWKGPRLSVDLALQKDIHAAGGWSQLIDLHLPL